MKNLLFLNLSRAFVAFTMLAAIALIVATPVWAAPGSYVTQKCEVTRSGSGWLAINTDIGASLTDERGEFAMRPSSITVFNGGSMPCYFNATGAPMPNIEVAPGAKVTVGLAVYMPQGEPIRSFWDYFKFWKGELPGTVSDHETDYHKFTRQQASRYSNQVRTQMDAMLAATEKLQSQKLPQSTKTDEYLRHFKQLMDAYLTLQASQSKRTIYESSIGYALTAFQTAQKDIQQSLSVIAASLDDVKAQEQPKPQPSASDSSSMGKVELAIAGLDNETTDKGNLDYWAWYIRWYLNDDRGKRKLGQESGNPDYITLANLDVSHVKKVLDALNREQAQWMAHRLREFVGDHPQPFSEQGVLSYSLEYDKEVCVRAAGQLEAKFGFTDSTQLPAPVNNVPVANPQKLTEVKQQIAALKQQVAALPKSETSVSDLAKVPAPLQRQYVRQIEARESKDTAALVKTLAPDYYFKDANGQVQTLTKWKAAQEASLKAHPNVKVSVRVDSIEKNGNDTVVTATQTIGTDDSNTEQKLKETWTESAKGWLLQSTEIMGDAPAPSVQPSNTVGGDPAQEVQKAVDDLNALLQKPDDTKAEQVAQRKLAQAKCEEALRLNPTNALLHYLMYEIVYPRISEVGVGHMITWDFRSVPLLLTRAIQARQELFEAVKLEPENEKYSLALAEKLNGLGDDAERLDNEVQKGKELRAQAELLCRNLLKSHPKSRDVSMRLTDILVGEEKFDEAEQILQNAIDASPNDADYHQRLGDLFRDQKRLTKAAEEYLKVARLVPENANDLTIISNDADSLSSRENYAGAEVLCRELVRRNPASSYYRACLGLYLLEQNKLDEAERELKKCIRGVSATEYPYNMASYHRWLGLVHMEQKRFADAETQFREAIKFQPTGDAAVDNLMALAGALLKQDKRDEAQQTAQGAIKLGGAGLFENQLFKDHWVTKELGLTP